MLWDKESGLNNLVMPRTGGDRLGGVVFLHETRGHVLLLDKTKRGIGSIRIGSEKILFPSVGQIKQMSRIVCCYIR